MGRSQQTAAATVRLWALSEDALVEEDPASGSLVVLSRWGEQRLDADAAARDLLRRMGLGPVSLGNVAAPRRGDLGDAADIDLDRLLDRLSGAVVHSLGLPDGQAPLLSATPVAARPRFRPEPVGPEQLVRLSRFASLRPLAGAFVLESPLAPYRVVLHHPCGVRVAGGLATAVRVSTLAPLGGVTVPVVADMVAFLVAAGVVVAEGQETRTGEDGPAYRLWTHHEMLFHMRTRTSHWDREATSADDGSDWTRAACVKSPPPGPRFALPRPDQSRLARTDPTLTELLDRDHACPRFGTAQLTAAQLGELLYRAARVRARGPAYVALGGVAEDSSQRPYFSIAGRYELELYLTVNRCADLPKGIFHYDPAQHALTLIRQDPAAMATLLDLAKVAAANSRRPAALITVTTRVERIAPVFGGAAYATTLMHVGALQQTLYLCGRAMGLSAHAVIADASDTVDRLLDLDWPAEVSVGECVLDVDESRGDVAGPGAIA